MSEKTQTLSSKNAEEIKDIYENINRIDTHINTLFDSRKKDDANDEIINRIKEGVEGIDLKIKELEQGFNATTSDIDDKVRGIIKELHRMHERHNALLNDVVNAIIRITDIEKKVSRTGNKTVAEEARNNAKDYLVGNRKLSKRIQYIENFRKYFGTMCHHFGLPVPRITEAGYEDEVDLVTTKSIRVLAHHRGFTLDRHAKQVFARLLCAWAKDEDDRMGYFVIGIIEGLLSQEFSLDENI